ncbi:hypothetical protein [Humisphaera borealis]|uniref:Uncharacterized protein n=1 Tax=Humisphaera borealis TaxID=2807512 RepID=A0A7M2X1E0_9BACT|nr:hypothetical protein [Humisphaera borealis]QOV91558.1 hypothetical protein IPV69_09440 [Humisphaera borealis]
MKDESDPTPGYDVSGPPEKPRRPKPAYPLPYARTRDYEPDRLPFGWSPSSHFLAGMGLGVLMSVVAWRTAYQFKLIGTDGSLWIAMALVMFAVKLTIGVAGLCLPWWRMAGAGMLTSISLGSLICGGALFATVCGGR